MQRSTTASKLVMLKGILMLLLGLVHEAIIPFEVKKVGPDLAHQRLVEYSCWFAMAGLFLVLTGLVDVLSASGIKRSDRLSWRLALSTSVLSTMTGSIGVGVNPSPPPAIILCLGITGLLTLFVCRSAYQPARG